MEIGELVLREDLQQALEFSRQRIASPGSWWTGPQRVALALHARAARSQRGDAPWNREKANAGDAGLPPAALEVAEVVAADAHRIDRAWASEKIETLGDAAYVEIVALVACLTAMDAFAEALGVAPQPLPEPRPGEPDRKRPEGLADIGAHVEMIDPFSGPNVARALTLAPDDLMSFFGLVGAMYAAQDFSEVVWAERPLSRPQVELVAARVSSLNECFY